MTALQAALFDITALLLIAYAVFDGFDLGLGALYPWVARNDTERKALRSAIAPVWDGNEVWLIIVGGVLFAAFPSVYAGVLSGFYLPFMLIVFALVVRAVSLGLHHGEAERPGLRTTGFFLGSLLPSFLFGLFAGNLIRGVSLSPAGDPIGGLGELFNPFAILIGLVSVVMFANQGACWAALKTHRGELHARARKTREVTAWLLVALLVAATIASYWEARNSLSQNAHHSLGWLAMVLLAVGIVYQLVVSRRPDDPLGRRDRAVFVASSAIIAGLVGIWAVGNYPVLVPARNVPAHSLTASGAAATRPALIALLVIALVGVPMMLGYTVVVYRLFRGRSTIEDGGKESY
ncbi:MAG TPA: cytochrome d ubiquinol oxidase subunit II [Thermoleophilia bacterium]|nr:cytochrome d ubiquinol oxidase subunit II [Thermoleophilia bacterium]